MNLNLSKTALKVLEARYLVKKGDKVIETPEQMFKRVAENIASAEEKYDGDRKKACAEFFDLMTSLDFLPNSPTLMNAGCALQQLSACFVLPVDDSMSSIFKALQDTALIHKSGGGTGFSFSRIRPRNDSVHATGGIASGPISFMKVYDAATEVIKQGGKRRGANMGILRVDHPDIMDFIAMKDREGFLANFNISVGLTDEFMSAYYKNAVYNLINPRTGKVTGKLKAKDVFNRIAQQAWKNGEPGIIFLDKINKANPTSHIGVIESTNPCGEQPLLPYESCNLGSLNLANMVTDKNVDWDKLEQRTRQAVRFLDNVIDMNKYPIPEISDMTLANRKIGLGVMGWADMLIKLGLKYDSSEALKLAEKVMKFITDKGIEKSKELAVKRGSFPNYQGSGWEKKGIKLRNATITTIAPTGSISIIAGVSSGIEPLFALGYLRKISIGDFLEIHPLFEKTARKKGFYSKELMEAVILKGSLKELHDVPKDVKGLFATTMDISVDWHIKTQAAFQKHVHNAVSKTINFPQHAGVDDIKNAYLLSYKLGCKGITVYRDKSRDLQVLNVGKGEDKKEGHDKLSPRERPVFTKGMTVRVRTGCGNMYVTINEDNQGLCEVFAQLGKAGGCPSSQTEAIARLISLILRSGIDIRSVIKELRGIRCPHPYRMKEGIILSCPDAMGIAIETYLSDLERRGEAVEQKKVKSLKIDAMNVDSFKKAVSETKKKNNALNGNNGFSLAESRNPVICPECGSTMVYAEGCSLCTICGFSKC